MYVLGLDKIIESAIASRAMHNIGGHVERLDALLTEESLRKLEEHHDGVFAFFAFHPKADSGVAEYLTGGSFAADAGPHVFAFFTMEGSLQMPRQLTLSALASMTIESGDVPAYRAVRQLFPADVIPPLPGIVFLQRFTGQSEPVFVSLRADDGAVREKARQALNLAAAAWVEIKKDGGGDFATMLAAKLAREGIPYERIGRRSMREWLAAAYRIANEHASTIVSVVKLFS